MSKIYDALLRAERERQAQAPEPEQKVSGNSELAPENASYPSKQWDVIAISPPLQPANVSKDDGIENPNSVHLAASVRDWLPDVQQLPALDSTGNKLEQLRRLRAKLFAIRDQHPIKSIYVGSGLPREGKSYIAANLAIILARHKASRVLLIDGDMRMGTLHKLLGCSNQPGLAEYLGGRASLDEILQRGRAVKPNDKLPQGLGSLTFCATGSAGNRAADLSASPRFSQLLGTLSPAFDWIIVDSSPVNLVSDGVNMARSCDAALLIARGGVTKFETAQRALKELKAATLIGVVLNAVEELPANGGSYGYQGYDSPEDPGDVSRLER